MKNLVLIGLMGTFKTSAGKKAAKLLKMDFLDTDDIIEREQRLSIPEIFSQFSEPHFRALESELSERLRTVSNTVISTGGGFALNAENVLRLKENALVVWLTAEPSEVFVRIKKSNRPFVLNGGTTEKLEELYSSRKEKYESVADIIIDNTKLSSLETAKKLIKIVKHK